MDKNTKTKRMDVVLTIGLIAVLMVGLFFANRYIDSYIKRVLNLCAIYAIISLSMNLVNGFTGQFSLGQAGFMALGAYAVGIFTLPLGMREQVFYMEPMHPAIANIELPLWAAIIVGGLVAAFVALLIGAPVLRLRGDYLAIATLGFSEIIRIVLTNAQPITNGALGITKVPGRSNMMLYFGVLIIVVIIMGLLVSSSYGRAFKAIREDEIAAEAMGIGLLKHKLLSFVIGSFFAGVGGGLYAAFLGTVDPKNFMVALTYNFLLIVVLGGMGSISGTVIASFIVTGGLEALRFFDEPLFIGGRQIALFRPGLRMVIYAIILIAIVLFLPQGIMGRREITWQSIRNLFKKKNKDGAVKQ